jgi:hypothetical protein
MHQNACCIITIVWYHVVIIWQEVNEVGNVIKEKLVGALGGFGIILWYIIIFVMAIAPLWILNLPWWLDGLIIAAIMFVPILGDIVNLGIWIWSFFIAINSAVNALVIIYFIVLGIYALIFILPILIALFSKKQ